MRVQVQRLKSEKTLATKTAGVYVWVMRSIVPNNTPCMAVKSTSPSRVETPLQLLADQSPVVGKLAVLQKAANQRPVMQRYDDLSKLYAETDDFDGKQEWIAHFTSAQKILNDGKLVQASISKLAKQMVENDTALHETLETAMAEHWGPQDTVMTGMVPPETFVEVVQDGRLFRDYVGQRHGVHTHQIQWFILYDNFGDRDLVHTMYRESVQPRWKIGSKNMWDRIVDGAQEKKGDKYLKTGDFTVPENLQTFFENKAPGKRSIRKDKKRRRALHQVVEGSAADQPESILAYRELYPTVADYNDALRDAIPAFVGPAASPMAMITALNAIRGEKLIHQKDDSAPRIEWTGWKRADNVDATHVFEPTVGRFLD